MNTLSSSAPSSRGAEATETPAREESVAAHARRALRARIAAMLDAAIAPLQALRTRVAGPMAAPAPDDEPERERERARRRPEAPPTPPVEVAPPRRRWLRGLLLSGALLLTGALAGAAGAYLQLQQQFAHQLREGQRREAALAHQARPTGEVALALERTQAHRADAEQKLLRAVAEYTDATAHTHARIEDLLGRQIVEGRRMETALAEQTRAASAARAQLAEAQTQRTRAESALAAAQDQHQQSMREQARQMRETERELARTERQLDKLLDAAESPAAGHREREPKRPARQTSAAKCTLEGDNVDALKRCIDAFNE